MTATSPNPSLSIPATPSLTQNAQTVGVRRHTYGQILKSSALIGGSSAINIAFGIVRTKAMALFLGPSGVGLMGLYNSIADLAQSIAGMGIQSSGVRQIAEAVGSGESERIARTVTVLKRLSLVLGVVGAAALLLFSSPVSNLTFGTPQHSAGVALLSVAVFLRLVSAGQGALIQGMRRISDLAMMSVLAALFGTLVAIPLVYFLGENGVVLSLVAIAAVTIVLSWWYSRKVHVHAPSMTLSQIRQESAALLRLGFAFMASAFLTMGAAYVIRIMVLRKLGFEAAGLYQSAWTLGGLYVGFILQAMGADFYPRLTAVSSDNAACNRMVNEQAQISLLLAGPGVIATLTFAPVVIAIFYSAKFYPAVDILRWVCLGMMLRVVSWPMGFIVVAKGAQTIFFWTEFAANAIHVGLAWLFVIQFGIAGSGAAFCALYLWYGVSIYAVVRRLSGFRFSALTQKISNLFLPLTAVVFGGFYVLPFWVATSIGMVAVLVSSIYSIRTLLNLIPLDAVPASVHRVLLEIGLAPPRAGEYPA